MVQDYVPKKSESEIKTIHTTFQIGMIVEKILASQCWELFASSRFLEICEIIVEAV
jgi:hypothetical protein